MTNPLKSDKSSSAGLLLARLPMGVFMLLAGVQKLQGGATSFASKYAGSIPSWASQEWGRQYLHAIPVLEVVIGAMLIFGFLGRLAALVGALMVISYTIAVTGWKAEPLPFSPNLIYIGLLLMTFLTGPGRISADGALFGKKSKSNFHPKD